MLVYFRNGFGFIHFAWPSGNAEWTRPGWARWGDWVDTRKYSKGPILGSAPVGL